MIRNKMKSATIAPKINRMIGMIPDEFLTNLITNPPNTEPQGLALAAVVRKQEASGRFLSVFQNWLYIFDFSSRVRRRMLITALSLSRSSSTLV
jgi:hypothetical protein